MQGSGGGVAEMLSVCIPQSSAAVAWLWSTLNSILFIDGASDAIFDLRCSKQ